MCLFRLHYQSVAIADMVKREHFFPADRNVITYVTNSYCDRHFFMKLP